MLGSHQRADRRGRRRPPFHEPDTALSARALSTAATRERRGLRAAAVRATAGVGCADSRCRSVRFTRPPRWCPSSAPRLAERCDDATLRVGALPVSRGGRPPAETTSVRSVRTGRRRSRGLGSPDDPDRGQAMARRRGGGRSHRLADGIASVGLAGHQCDRQRRNHRDRCKPGCRS